MKRLWNFLRAPVSGRTVVFSALSALLLSFLIARADTNFLGTIFVADPNTPSRQMAVNADGSINTSGTTTITNPTIGAAVPATANYIAGNKGGLLTGVLIDSSGYVQAALTGVTGTAGTAATGVLSVQGIASMTPLLATVTNAGTFAAQADITKTGGGVLPAAGVAAAGVPVPIGGDFNTTAATITNGQRGQMQLDAKQNVRMSLMADGTVTPIGANSVANGASLGAGLSTRSALMLYNSSTFDPLLEAANALNSTGTGLATAQIVGQCDDTSPTALTENSFGNARVSCADHSQYVSGIVAGGATASGNTVPIGAEYNSTLPTYTNGQRANLQTGTKGSLNTTICAVDAVSCATVRGINTDASPSGVNAATTQSANYQYNGASWDREFACSSFAAVSVTAGNTTQIIALSASTIIRVCSITLSTSLTGTFTVLSGTGSNCGTPANSTGALGITTSTPITINGGNSAVYRGTAGGELCVAAATGNITGWVMYTQY